MWDVRYEGTSRGSVQNSARLLSSPGNGRVERSRSYKAESQPKSVMRGIPGKREDRVSQVGLQPTAGDLHGVQVTNQDHHIQCPSSGVPGILSFLLQVGVQDF